MSRQYAVMILEVHIHINMTYAHAGAFSWHWCSCMACNSQQTITKNDSNGMSGRHFKIDVGVLRWKWNGDSGPLYNMCCVVYV